MNKDNDKVFQPGSGRRLAWGFLVALFMAATAHVVQAIVYAPINGCGSEMNLFWQLVLGCW